MIPGWSTIKVVQTVPVGCISRSRGQKNRFSKCNFHKSSCPKLQGPELSYLVYSIIQRSSTKVVQIMPLGSILTPPQGSQFYIDLYKETSNDIFSLTANGNLTKLHRNDFCVVPYQSCLNRSSWLHK